MPFTLSHHPECESYSKHYLNIRGYKFCIGCLFIYSSTIFFALMHLLFGIMTFFMRFKILLCLMIIFFILYGAKVFDRHILLKIASKIYFGFLAIAFILFVYYSVTASYFIRIVLAFMAYLIIANTMTAIRGYKILKTCSKCPQWNLFPLCDGFNKILKRLEKEGFVSIVWE